MNEIEREIKNYLARNLSIEVFESTNYMETHHIFEIRILLDGGEVSSGRIELPIR